MAASKPRQLLCNINDIPDNSCKGFTIGPNENKLEIFVLRRNNKIFAYKNHCPHTGANLNWQPDIFMDYDNLYIQCAIHGARFEIETGLCVWGPCVNQSLIKLNVLIEDEYIYIPSD